MLPATLEIMMQIRKGDSRAQTSIRLITTKLADKQDLKVGVPAPRLVDVTPSDSDSLACKPSIAAVDPMTLHHLSENKYEILIRLG